ncbi:hypothetical protein NKH49_30155 [Mesorhizobium sp. M1088]|uniref:RHS repeat-associated core domain-containing protein n=1 Tax=Mesorhizobium sp. M1088 TaxID=2957056 RepID=UPI00333AC15B
MPQARGLAQPRLSITYRSSAGDAEAGFAWGLDVPKIENRPLSGWPERGSGGAASRERFAIDGRPLVAICTTGGPNVDVPPCEPDLLIPSWAQPGGAGWIYYREQNDRSFSRYFLSPDRATWRVQLKGGVIQEFGRPLHMANLAGAAYETDGNTIVRWRLVRQFEAARPQNAVVYRWRVYGKRGLLYLTDIWDTPRADGTLDVRHFAHHTQLGWTIPDFRTISYASRLKSTPDLNLSAVGVTSASWEATGTRDVIRLYNLVYMQPRTVPLQYSEQAPLFQHSFLQAIGMQGRCGYRETDDGDLPRLINCPYLPLTTFTYQKPGGDAYGGTSTDNPGYNPGSFGGTISKVNGADPGIAQRNGVLPYINSAAVVDFNRDGLPDLVQSWEAEAVCFGKAGYVRVRFPTNGLPSQLECVNATSERVIRSTRPMMGWLNTSASIQPEFTYQCMDGGGGARGTLPWFIREGLPPSNRPRLASFLAGQGAPTILGNFGDSPLIWGGGEASFRPFRATRVPAEAAFCDKPDTTPGWRWEPGSFDLQAWPKNTGILGKEDGVSGPRWFADIDGDGLVDQLGSATGSTFNGYLDNTTPLYTRQYAEGERFAGGGAGPAQVPFVSPGNNNALVPSTRAPAGTRFFYTDVNADGLTDLAYFPPVGPLVVRPGDGRGNFRCDPAREPLGCSGDEYLATTPDAAPWNVTGVAWNPRFERYLRDVNGDGLADIVMFRDDTNPQLSGLVQLWINVDGHTFRCATAPAPVPCVVSRMVDDVHGSTLFGAHRVDFADMDGNGVDEMVLMTPAGAAVTQFEPILSISDFGSPRLGLLTRVSNGVGAITDIKYASLAQLMARASTPWKTVVPTPALVVDTIRTHNDVAPTETVADPIRFSRRKVYTYRDPAYDSWTRSFLGFRQVDVQTGDEYAVTRTTYWFGPCQQPTITQQCLGGSDNDPEGPRTGLPIRIERIVAGTDPYKPQEVLSSTDMSYENRVLFQRDRERDVRTAFLVGRETRVYTPKGPFGPGLEEQGGGGDVRVHSPTQNGVVPVAETASYDNLGNLIKSRRLGRVRDGVNTGVSSPAGPDPVLVTWHGSPSGSGGDIPGPMRCDRELWICFDEAITTTTDKAQDHGYQTLRKKRIGYTSQGDIASIEGWLNAAYPQLNRHHVNGAAVAPLPTGLTTGAGWHRLLTSSYDQTYGGLVRQQLPGDPGGCTGYAYDTPFRQFVATARQYYAGCEGRALEQITAYERAFGLLSRSVGPAGETTSIIYETFGRPQKVELPLPDGASAGQTVETFNFTYADNKAFSMVSTLQHVGTDTLGAVDVVNALGEHIAKIQLIDTNSLLVRDWVQRNGSGRIATRYQPFLSNVATILAVPGTFTLSPASGTLKLETFEDSYGRLDAVFRNGDRVLRYAYEPYETIISNAAQIAGTDGRTLIEHDGFGRIVKSLEQQGSASIETELTYTATGEEKAVARGSGGSLRTITTREFDTLGRLVRQSNPNSGAFTYGWDDTGRLVGTSDARGCGENLFYDGLGRLRGEDYSPCERQHAPYSPVTGTSSDGFEVAYTYDQYPVPVASDGTFQSATGLALGKLTEIRDRGARSRMGYDNRSRLRSLSRALAVPGAPAGTYSLPFLQRSDYDLGERLTMITTGARTPELSVGGTSRFTFAHLPRGLISTIGSSFGTILDNIEWAPTDMITHLRYGDIATTEAKFQYDPIGRLSDYAVSRSAPFIWMRPPGDYSQPDGTTTQTDLLHHVYSFDVLNRPTAIDDLSASIWPSGADPQRFRQYAYDDLGRLLSAGIAYTSGGSWSNPFGAEEAGESAFQFPTRKAASRAKSLSFAFDAQGNLSQSTDDLNLPFDRSLGATTLGTPAAVSDQLTEAAATSAQYDRSGNVTRLYVTRRSDCASTVVTCSHLFAFDWDEVGQLERSRRWDFLPGGIPLLGSGVPDDTPTWDRRNGYSLGQRVLSGLAPRTGATHYDLDPLGTLHISGATVLSDDFQIGADNEEVRLSNIASIRYDAVGSLPKLSSAQQLHVFFHIPDALGSPTVTIDGGTSEVVERTTYLPFGATDSDYRPQRWGSYRNTRRFIGKTEDPESGLLDFGTRFYSPYLGRFLSPDPLSVHALDPDGNAYAYAAGNPIGNLDRNGLDPYTDANGVVHMDPAYINGTPPPPPPPAPPTPPPTAGSQATHAGAAGVLPLDRNTALNAAIDNDQPIHIPFTDNSFFTINHTRNEMLNGIINGLIDQADPLGLVDGVRTVSGGKADLRAAVHQETGGDSNDESKTVGRVALVLPLIWNIRGWAEISAFAAEDAKLVSIMRNVEALESAKTTQQTIAVAVGRDGSIAVATSRAGFLPATEAWIKSQGYIVSILEHTHAEGTVISGSGGAFVPYRGVASNIICGQCTTWIQDGLGGVRTGPRSFFFPLSLPRE